jgi:hypothetical protein
VSHVASETDKTSRLTSDIYPGDLGWAVNWDKPEERQEWYHNISSITQAGPCVRSNQLDYDEDTMHKVRQIFSCTFSESSKPHTSRYPHVSFQDTI